METLFDPKIYLDGNQFPKFRAMLLGNSKVGKTSLLNRYMNHCFRDEYYPTKELM
jgi:GTPase SAR1 family protein